VGITSDDTNGALGSLHIRTSIDGTPATDETVAVLNVPTALPKEVPLTAPASDLSANVDVSVDGYLDPQWDPSKTTEQPILSRLAHTNFVPNQSVLLRVHLDRGCVTSAAGAGFLGPTCTAPQTCIMGQCADDSVPPSRLEPYTPGWAQETSDACKPLGAGPPVVQVGTGQTDFLPLVDGQTVQAELGPQGGHHIWIAARQENLKQTGTTTTITGVQPNGGPTVPPTSFVFVWNPDQGGFCKLYGLRFQLDSGGTDYHLFLGKPLDVTLTIHDQDGATGTATVHIDIAPTVLCPNGQTCP
jgi:hypothetical protein